MELQTIVNIFTIIAGFVAASSVYYLAKQIKVSVEQEKTKKAHEFIIKYNNPQFKKVIPEVIKILNDITDESVANGEKFKELKEGTEKRNKLTLLLNFFEEMGIIYNRDLANKKIIKEFFRGMSLEYYKGAEKFIKKIREISKNPRFFENWEEMNKNFKD